MSFPQPCHVAGGLRRAPECALPLRGHTQLAHPAGIQLWSSFRTSGDASDQAASRHQAASRDQARMLQAGPSSGTPGRHVAVRCSTQWQADPRGLLCRFRSLIQLPWRILWFTGAARGMQGVRRTRASSKETPWCTAGASRPQVRAVLPAG